MEPSRLAQPRRSALLEKYAPLLDEANLTWLSSAEAYHRSGHINEPLLDVIVRACHLFEISQRRSAYLYVKTIGEWVVSGLLLLLVSPFIALIAILIKLGSPGPVFYRQLRIGRGMKPFFIVKFRTMFSGAERNIPFVNNNARGGIFKVKKDPRITPVGFFLRRWSLDELPQLWNIVKGEMALVGPRPLPCYDSATAPSQSYVRYAVRPGLTGLWQVDARSEMDGRAMFALDTEYIKKFGPALDFRILLKTVKVVLQGDGSV